VSHLFGDHVDMSDIFLLHLLTCITLLTHFHDGFSDASERLFLGITSHGVLASQPAFAEMRLTDHYVATCHRNSIRHSKQIPSNTH